MFTRKTKIPYDAQPPLVQKMIDLQEKDKQIERYREVVLQIDAQLRKCTSRLTGQPRGGQPMSWDDLITQKDEMLALIAEEQSKKNAMACDIASDPDAACLDMDEYRVLSMRYMAGMRLREIAEILHMGRTTVYELERRAIRKARAAAKPEQIRTNPNKSEQTRTNFMI